MRSGTQLRVRGFPTYFWVFGDFRCDVFLFIVFLVLYQFRNRYK